MVVVTYKNSRYVNYIFFTYFYIFLHIFKLNIKDNNFIFILYVMKTFNCDHCNFSSNLKSDLNRHLKTKKHIKNIRKVSSDYVKNMYFSSKTLQNPPKSMYFPSKTLQNGDQFNCDYCDKVFSRKDNLTRHLQGRCKLKNVDYKDLFYDMKKQLEEEKSEFKKHIEILLKKVGNTTINNTQNIQLNNYGNENLSHITESLKTQLIKKPYGMISKLIEHVHFNESHPENKNIALTNKSDNKIKIFTGNKWIYKNKTEIVNDLVDGKYFILDTHYDSICDTLDKKNKHNYYKFREYYDEKNNKVLSELNKECELVLLNNR